MEQIEKNKEIAKNFFPFQKKSILDYNKVFGDFD